MPNKVTYKRDVFDALVTALVRLAKNDPERTRKAIQRAEQLLERWLVDRPEKAALTEEPALGEDGEINFNVEECGN
jgi:hypothetical protein